MGTIIEVDVVTGDVVSRPTTPEEETSLTATTATPYVPVSITRRQCARQMLVMTLISSAEALAMTKSGEPPAMVAAMFTQLPPEDAILAEIDFAADTYVRSNPLLISLMTATGADAAAIDQFFRDAAAL